MPDRILLIEDEADLARSVSYALRGAGYEVTVASDGRSALSLVRQVPPVLILLDLMLPDMSGLDICRTLKSDKRTSAIPVVMMTAKGEELDRVVGFEVGADDYVVKPFSVRELALRIKAILRRKNAASEEAPRISEVGVLKIDKDAHRVNVDGKDVRLTAIEFRLLTTLLERQDRVQSRDALLSDVWGIHLSVETRTVDTHIKRLREKLGQAGRYIETVRGVGYRFARSEAISA